ncbi:hypothetical protein L1987_21568 [Smallanthus sonchifolius]|uniref:Uncharacterized protein n=1 Tax=Smallanthus sonchifolius TaxID=185202 RepID=A0ACB9IVG5_9ASTR|nr:hypothetical protein L1987_21568 [Smallanthus sonchifolius]
MEAKMDVIVNNLKSIKDQIDRDAHSKKLSSSNFWSMATVCNKKWQKGRRKQKKNVVDRNGVVSATIIDVFNMVEPARDENILKEDTGVLYYKPDPEDTKLVYVVLMVRMVETLLLVYDTEDSLTRLCPSCLCERLTILYQSSSSSTTATKSGDVRRPNLISIDNENKPLHNVNNYECEEIRVFEDEKLTNLNDLENDIVEMEAKIDAIVNNLESIKDQIDRDAHSKKLSSSNFWLMATVCK